MLISIEKVKEIDKFQNIDEDLLKSKLDAIETFIRGNYTNNGFYNRLVKFNASSSNNKILGVNPYLKANDTVEIFEGINKGLYTIKTISGNEIELDRNIYDYSNNLVVKVEYPADVVQGALDMLEWVFGAKEKVGVKSETLSRHSVTYEDSSSFISGYPKSLLGFLEPYLKARF